MIDITNTAILFFSRSIHGEAQHKYWDKHLNHSKRLELSALLIKKTLNTLRGTGLTVYYYDEEIQKGNTFGEKIANAHEDLFQKGHEGIITVGNDCLELDKVNWVNLVDSISNGVTCIGPNYRNGAYLMATPKLHFDKETFAKLDWQGKTLLSQLLTLQKNAKVLPQLSDFNDVRDLHLIIDQGLVALKLTTLLVRLFSIYWVKPLAKYTSRLEDLSILRFISLRAPPAA